MTARHWLTADRSRQLRPAVIVPAFLTGFVGASDVYVLLDAAHQFAFVCRDGNGRVETMAVSTFHAHVEGEPTSYSTHFSRS